jgi:uncharacterized repeat protein (TIGR03987 family)
MLILAIISITLALVLYTIGVWGERIQKILKPWHVIIFWFGFICDTTGTTLMNQMSENTNFLNFHAITGGLAIILMFSHALWATIVLIRNKETLLLNFHKFSLLVWIIWLIPYLSGIFVGLIG